MNDRLPGSSYSNPVWHGRWRIYLSDFDHPETQYAYSHDDYDGAEDANDSRCGHARSIEHAKQQIDEWEAEHA